MTALEVLLKVHSKFFQNLQAAALVPKPLGSLWDVRHIMNEERSRVLDGVHLVFSRVIPLEQQPETHPLWRLAMQFGATCSAAYNDATTHVIAVVSGTEKVGAGDVKAGLFLTCWLLSCFFWCYRICCMDSVSASAQHSLPLLQLCSMRALDLFFFQIDIDPCGFSAHRAGLLRFSDLRIFFCFVLHPLHRAGLSTWLRCRSSGPGKTIAMLSHPTGKFSVSHYSR